MVGLRTLWEYLKVPEVIFSNYIFSDVSRYLSNDIKKRLSNIKLHWNFCQYVTSKLKGNHVVSVYLEYLPIAHALVIVCFLLLDSPASDTSAPGRPKRGRERPNQSPVHEEEESESSSAKEDDVELQERDRTPPQKRATRRKRKERSPYAKQESKDSAEDESSLSEFPIERWGDDTKGGAFGDKEAARGKTPDKKKEKLRSNRGRPASQRIKHVEESIHEVIPEYDRQSSAMAILSDCALMKKEGTILFSNEEDLEEGMSPREEDMQIDDVIIEQGKSAPRSHKRKSENKISHEKKVMKIEGELSIGKSKQKIEKGESMDESPDKLMMEGRFEEQHIDEISNIDIQTNKMKNENNNVNECPMPDDNGLACMEHVVDILQQAAAIEAENQRKLSQGMSSLAHGKTEPVSEMRSPSGGHATPDKDRRKKRKERKRRRRAPSCSVAEASESENGCLQSPVRAKRERNHSTVVLEKEKFDFVSDLGR